MAWSDRDRLRGAAYGLAAAALFGLSAPLAKLLLASGGPLVLAGLLYVGGGLALSLVRMARRAPDPLATGREARLRPADAPLVLAIVVSGGIVGPVLMLFGLARVSGVTGALLLNLEAPLTVLLAVAAFGEHLGWREALAAALVFAGAIALSWSPGEMRVEALGAAALAGACASWALDNNLTQRLTLRDPVALVRAKALGAGLANLALGLAVGEPAPAAGFAAAALGVGAASYGLSIVLDAYALRLLGAAREAAFFATAPFVGALAAVPLLGEAVRMVDVAAALVMAAGVGLMLREEHSHEHVHEPLVHDHAHMHDEHHQHDHEGPGSVPEPHSHPHRHAPLRHAHPHASDAHHRHRHG